MLVQIGGNQCFLTRGQHMHRDQLTLKSFSIKTQHRGRFWAFSFFLTLDPKEIRQKTETDINKLIFWAKHTVPISTKWQKKSKANCKINRTQLLSLHFVGWSMILESCSGADCVLGRPLLSLPPLPLCVAIPPLLVKVLPSPTGVTSSLTCYTSLTCHLPLTYHPPPMLSTWQWWQQSTSKAFLAKSLFAMVDLPVFKDVKKVKCTETWFLSMLIWWLGSWHVFFSWTVWVGDVLDQERVCNHFTICQSIKKKNHTCDIRCTS